MVPVTPSLAEVVIALQIKARVKQRGAGRHRARKIVGRSTSRAAEVSRGVAMSLAAPRIIM
jgi:hypothetical protein